MSRRIGLPGLVIAGMLIGACSSSPPGASPSASTAAPPTSAAATASPTSSAGTVIPLPEAGSTVFAGMYTTHFQPALTFTIDHVVDLDCVAGYQCRGDVSKNDPGFVDLEFGNVHGSEIDIFRLAEVYDPASPEKLIDPPADLAAWMKAVPGTAVFGSPVPVTIGGIAGTQFDVTTPGETQFGQIAAGGGQAGIGPSALRVVVISVHGQAVMITEWIGADNTIRDGAAALSSLQPLVQSIVWS